MANSSVRFIAALPARPDSERIRAAITGDGRVAAQSADTLIATFAQITAALAPIIGSQGVAALCKRSVYVAGQTHGWLLGSHENLQAPMDFPALRMAVAGQNDAEAATGAALLLHTFNEVLAGLIGPSLTERLLRTVWAQLLTSAPAQDKST